MAEAETLVLYDALTPLPHATSNETIEEKCFSSCLIMLEGHFNNAPPMGPLTSVKVVTMVNKTLELTHGQSQVRESLSRNVGIWLWITRIFFSAIPSLTDRSIGQMPGPDDPEKDISPQESTALIVKNHSSIRDDLLILTKIMNIARNILVTPTPVVPQDICTAVHFNQMVYQTIILCVNVTSKGYEGEMKDEASKTKLCEIIEAYKKLLVAALQQAHNWIAKHDRNKMAFWHDVLFDEDGAVSEPPEELDDGSFPTQSAKSQISHWLHNNSEICADAKSLLLEYAKKTPSEYPGEPTTPHLPLACYWLPHGAPPEKGHRPRKFTSVWNPDEPDLEKRDKAYGRVSRDIDTWWLRNRDPNFEDLVITMASVESARSRIGHCISHIFERFAGLGRKGAEEGSMVVEAGDENGAEEEGMERGGGGKAETAGPEENEEEAGGRGNTRKAAAPAGYYADDGSFDYDHGGDDDESYFEGPLTGILSEIPNILDPKQIEALHMIVRSCIFNPVWSGFTEAGENLQETRCKMFLALDCGKSLFRELLVFIAVWEKDEQSIIFRLLVKIIEAIHHNALVPYAWATLRIAKDIISPAQAVLLRVVSYMFRGQPPPSRAERLEQIKRKNAAAATAAATTMGEKVDERLKEGEAAAEEEEGEFDDAADPLMNFCRENDIGLLHFFFAYFRTRVVPEVVALIHLQGRYRKEPGTLQEFPVDHWDMERARDGLAQYLDLLTSAAEAPDMRAKLVEWEAVYDLIVILNALEEGVARKIHVDVRTGADAPNANRVPTQGQKMTILSTAKDLDPFTYKFNASHVQDWRKGCELEAPPTPNAEDEPGPAYAYPWTGIKAQILTIIATLLQPPPGQTGPGNPEVQAQVIKFGGMVPLLRSSFYDGNQPFAKERVILCLRWLLDGCEAANRVFREMAATTSPTPQGPVTTSPEASSSQQQQQRQQQQRQQQQQPTSDAVTWGGWTLGPITVMGPDYTTGNPLEDDFM